MLPKWLSFYISPVSLAKYQKELNNFMLVTKYFIFPVGIICGLILPENLSTALMIFGMSMIIMFIGRVPVKFLLAYVGMAVVGVILFAMVLTVVKKITGSRSGKTGLSIFFQVRPTMMLMEIISQTRQRLQFQQVACSERHQVKVHSETCCHNQILISFLQ